MTAERTTDVGLNTNVADGTSVGVGDGVGVAVWFGVGVAVGEAVGVAVGVEGVGVAVGVAVAIALADAETTGVGLAVGPVFGWRLTPPPEHAARAAHAAIADHVTVLEIMCMNDPRTKRARIGLPFSVRETTRPWYPGNPYHFALRPGQGRLRRTRSEAE